MQVVIGAVIGIAIDVYENVGPFIALGCILAFFAIAGSMERGSAFDATTPRYEWPQLRPFPWLPASAVVAVEVMTLDGGAARSTALSAACVAGVFVVGLAWLLSDARAPATARAGPVKE